MGLPTPRDRVLAALHGEVLDRPAMTLWQHWPVDDQQAGTYARVSVEHRAALGLDLVKLTPSAAFMAEAWGARTTYDADPLGVRTYRSRPVTAPADWGAVATLSVADSPTLRREVDAVRLVRAQVGPDVPVLPTVFTPLSVVRYLSGDGLFLAHLRRHRDQVAPALRAIAATSVALVRALLEAGADGIYFSLFPASDTMVSEAEYRAVALPFDQEVMAAAADAPVRVAHFHLPFPLLALARELPVNVASWEHTAGGPTLRDGMELTRRTVMGGVDQRLLATAAGADVVRATRAATRLARTPGTTGMILATSCSYPLTTPRGNLLAFTDTVRAAPA